MQIKKLFAFGFLCFCIGCTSNETIVSKPMKEYAAVCSERHKKIEKNVLPMDVYKGKKPPMDAYFHTLTYMFNHSAKSSPQADFTRAEAEKDIDAMFSIFQNVYGNYDVFGGDTVFQKAKAEIIHDLSHTSKIRYDTVSSIIRKHLAFINDAHVQIDYTQLQATPILYESARPMVFQKKNDTFYYQGKAIHKIHNDTHLHTYLKPQQTKRGETIYHFFYETQEQLEQVSIQFQDKQTMNIKLSTSSITQNDTMIDTKAKAGIPYVGVRKMFFPNVSQREKEQTNMFLKQADVMKNSNVAILDLRGNSGGNNFLSYAWVKAFTKENVYGNMISLLKFPAEDARIQKPPFMWSQDIGDLTSIYDKVNDVLYIEKNNQKGKTFVKQPTILFVLQDRLTASAAEHLIDLLHNVENVIFVGTPSAGLLQGSAFMNVYLQYTSLQMRIGNLQEQFSKSYAKEYYGIQPDIWVHSDDALDYVLHLLK